MKLLRADAILFLDVDNVLLAPRSTGTPECHLARHAIEFLSFSLVNFRVVRWLSTHCTRGDTRHIVGYIADHAEEHERDQVVALASQVLPTTYKTLKTEALPRDPSARWFWCDDDPIWSEREFLRKAGMLDRWLQIDTGKRPDDLLRAISILRGIHAENLPGLGWKGRG